MWLERKIESISQEKAKKILFKEIDSLTSSEGVTPPNFFLSRFRHTSVTRDICVTDFEGSPAEKN
ncbi:MAG: hypothetical protein IJR94_01795 [Synergistaceae bacterium]|nr:hypothetical protein [Synergistaceae bacterium]